MQNLVHHIIKETLACIYCSDSSQQLWCSEWNKDHHYKAFTCKRCGRKNYLKACFQGSGHDSFGDLEKKLAYNL
jgi:hypothetical protein